MSSITETLKEEHVAVLELVLEANTALMNGDVGVVKALDRLRQSLDAHVETEDRQLYTRLERVAGEKSISNFSDTAQTFGTRIEGIRQRLEIFSRRYSKLGAMADEHKHEWWGFVTALGHYIWTEELHVYQMYEDAIG